MNELKGFKVLNIEEAKKDISRLREQLKNLESKDISVLKQLNNPPASIGKLGAALMKIEGKSGDWAEFQKATKSVKTWTQNMILFDKDNAVHLLTDLKPFVKDPCFNIASMKCISSSAGGVVSWILNLFKYVKITEQLKKRGVNPDNFIESPSKKTISKGKKKKKSPSKGQLNKTIDPAAYFSGNSVFSQESVYTETSEEKNVTSPKSFENLGSLQR